MLASRHLPPKPHGCWSSNVALCVISLTWCPHAGSSFLSYILSSFPSDAAQGTKAFHEEEDGTTPSHQKIQPSDLLTKSLPELLEQVCPQPYLSTCKFNNVSFRLCERMSIKIAGGPAPTYDAQTSATCINFTVHLLVGCCIMRLGPTGLSLKNFYLLC